MSWKIYHNPRCSKSRQTLELLKEKGIHPEVIEYLKTPLSQKEMEQLFDLLPEPQKIVRVKEQEYSDDPFDVSSKKTVVAKLLQIPKLMERPIVVYNGQAALGRPPEDVLKLLDA